MVCPRFVKRYLGKEGVHLQANPYEGDTGTEHITASSWRVLHLPVDATPGSKPFLEVHSTSLAPTLVPCTRWQEHGVCMCVSVHTHPHIHRDILMNIHSSTHIHACTSFYPGSNPTPSSPDPVFLPRSALRPITGSFRRAGLGDAHRLVRSAGVNPHDP